MSGAKSTLGKLYIILEITSKSMTRTVTPNNYREQAKIKPLE